MAARPASLLAGPSVPLDQPEPPGQVLPTASGPECVAASSATAPTGAWAGSASMAAVEKAKDKARRDASLYASLVARNSAAKASDPDRGYLLVSSSRRLSEVEDIFKELGERDFVITVGMALYLVSLVPEVSLGIGSLRAFLFDGPPTAFSSGLEILLLRVNKGVDLLPAPLGKADKPYAKGATTSPRAG